MTSAPFERTLTACEPPLAGAARAFAVTYLLAQSLAIVIFWVTLWQVPPIRRHFVLENAPDASFLSLWLADAILLPVTGTLAAWGLVRERAWTRAVLWLHAGAALYAGLYALGLWIADRRLWLGGGLMVPVLVTPLSIALAAAGRSSTAARSPLGPVLRTAAQVVVFWGFFLLIVPHALLLLEGNLGVDTAPDSAARRLAAGIVFAVASTLGLASAWHMAVHGRGTPLPTDPTRRLVVTGPYAFVRNPMAVAGLAQGLAVALWHGSWTLVAYVALGAILWQVGPRPIEERELEARFGDAFRRYRHHVPCWRPRATRFVLSRTDHTSPESG
jgi:protein-S-isoprenylcysteine O-methyltransferase Ste14